MKVIKRLFKLLLVAVVVVVLLGVAVFVRSRQQPDWYAQIRSYDMGEAAAAAAQQADEKVQSTWAWISARQAAEARARQGDTRPPLTPVPAADFSVTFSERELNAAFDKWKDALHWDETYSQYVTNPVIAIRDGRIILAGTVSQFDRVVSFHFRPALDKAAQQMRIDLESVMAGRLPMPQAAFEHYREQLVQKTSDNLPEYRADAKLRPDGSVNDSAEKAMVGQLLLSVLQRQTVDPVLLIKGNSPQPGQNRLVPVRVVDVTLKDQAVTFTLETMTAGERQAWLDRLRRGVAATHQ